MVVVCCICLDSTDSNFGVLRNCSHWYHESCIKKWFKVQKSCPLCKKDFLLKDILLLPVEIIQNIQENALGKESTELQNLSLENSSLKKNQTLFLREIEELRATNSENYIVKDKLLKCLSESKKQISKLEIQLKINLDNLDNVKASLQEEKAKRIKAEVFTKHWNFSSDFDLRKWQGCWDELESSLDSIDLKELLFDYHKKVGETNSWLLESNQTISTLKKKLLKYKSVNKDLENQVEFLKISGMKENQRSEQTAKIRQRVLETERIIPPGSFKKSKVGFNSLRFTEPVNRVIIEPEKNRSTVPFKRI